MFQHWWRRAGQRADVSRQRSAEAGDGFQAPEAVDAAELSEDAAAESRSMVESAASGGLQAPQARRTGRPFNRRSPFYMGFLAALGALLAYGFVQTAMQLGQVFLLIVVSLFLSLGLEPLVVRLVRRGLTRPWAVLVVTVGVLAVFSLVGWLVIPTAIDEVTHLVHDAPTLLDRLTHSDFVQALNARFHMTTRIEDSLRSSISQQHVLVVFGGILGAGQAVVDNTVSAFTVLVLTLYFLATMPRAKAAAYRLVPHSRRARVVYLGEEISRRVSAYIFGQVCVATLNGVLTFVMVKLLGLPFPLLLATLVGLLALVPIIGTLVGGVILTLVGLTNGWESAVVVLVYYIAYHVFEAYVLTPRVMQRVIEMPPAVTIVAVIAGGTLLGVLGALIAIPTAAALMVLYEQVAVPHQQKA